MFDRSPRPSLSPGYVRGVSEWFPGEWLYLCMIYRLGFNRIIFLNNRLNSLKKSQKMTHLMTILKCNLKFVVVVVFVDK